MPDLQRISRRLLWIPSAFVCPQQFHTASWEGSLLHWLSRFHWQNNTVHCTMVSSQCSPSYPDHTWLEHNLILISLHTPIIVHMKNPPNFLLGLSSKRFLYMLFHPFFRSRHLVIPLDLSWFLLFFGWFLLHFVFLFGQIHWCIIIRKSIAQVKNRITLWSCVGIHQLWQTHWIIVESWHWKTCWLVVGEISMSRLWCVLLQQWIQTEKNYHFECKQKCWIVHTPIKNCKTKILRETNLLSITCTSWSNSAEVRSLNCDSSSAWSACSMSCELEIWSSSHNKSFPTLSKQQNNLHL